MRHNRTARLSAILALVFLPLIAPSTASGGLAITFVHEGTSQGFTLDGDAFPGPWVFIITAFGDVGDREELPGVNGWYIDHRAAMIEIIGFGEFDILTPTRTFVGNTAELVGFARAGPTGANLFTGPRNPAFADWDMTTSIGPIFGDDGRLLQWHIEPRIETTGGILVFDDENEVPVTFTAVVIPSPAPMALLPVAAVLCPRRRRRC